MSYQFPAPHWRILTLVLAAVVAATASSGCSLNSWVRNGFKVGPTFVVPAAPVAMQWIDYGDPRISSDAADLCQWWGVFQDPILDGLIAEAASQNLSLRVAGARIMEARAELGFAKGNIFPQSQGVGGGFSRIKTPAPVSEFFSQWFGDASFAWELDFWGKFRRAIEAAGDELDATVDAYSSVLVLLNAEVASNYVNYRTFEARLAYATENVQMQEASLELAQKRFGEGATGQGDVQQARQVLEQTRALIPILQTGIRQSGNALCILLGRPPQDIEERLGSSPQIPSAPENIVIGIPADLLRRRPDIRQAERLAAAQCARIGIAVADFYPQVSLVGSLGAQSDELTQLFDFPGSLAANITPSFRWPLLHYFRLANNVRVQETRFEALVLSYQETVLQAAREAEDSIYQYIQSHARSDRTAESVDAAERALHIAEEQYREGAADYTAVYLLQSTVAQQQDELAIAQGAVALSLIGTYRALGGGWSPEAFGCSSHSNPPCSPAVPAVSKQMYPPAAGNQNDESADGTFGRSY